MDQILLAAVNPNFSVVVDNLLSFLNGFGMDISIFQPIGFGDLLGAGSSGAPAVPEVPATP